MRRRWSQQRTNIEVADLENFCDGHVRCEMVLMIQINIIKWLTTVISIASDQRLVYLKEITWYMRVLLSLRIIDIVEAWRQFVIVDDVTDVKIDTIRNLSLVKSS